MALWTPKSLVASRAILEVSPYRKVASTMAGVVKGGTAPVSERREDANDAGVHRAVAARQNADLGEVGPENPDAPGPDRTAAPRLDRIDEAIAPDGRVDAGLERNPRTGAADQPPVALISEFTATPSPEPGAAATAGPPQARETRYLLHQVQTGESLAGLAEEYNTSIEVLTAANQA